MNLRVTITVPSVKCDGTPIPERRRSSVLLDTIRTMSALFGGCTATDAIGGYLHDDGRLVTENVTVCSSYVMDEDPDIALEVALETIALDLAHKCEQESVLWTVEELRGRVGFAA